MNISTVITVASIIAISVPLYLVINNNIEQIQLGFYNVEHDGSILNGELQIAETLANIINCRPGLKH